MKVSYTLELAIVIEDDDSAEEFRREIEKSVGREWVREDGDSLSVKTRSIE